MAHGCVCCVLCVVCVCVCVCVCVYVCVWGEIVSAKTRRVSSCGERVCPEGSVRGTQVGVLRVAG